MKRRRFKPWRLRLGRLLALVLVLLVLVSLLPVLALRWLPPPTTVFMLQHRIDGYFSQGEWPQLEYRWVAYERIAPVMAVAVIAAEDQNFAHHRGFDFAAIHQAFIDNLDNKRLRGASTISQQVAKNLFLPASRTYLRKLLEAWFTLLIESCWPKQRILEVYLNIAQLGPQLYGVEAAAQRYFKRHAERLNPAQAALLAATLPNPKRFSAARPSPYVRKRQRWILQQMRNLDGSAYLQQL